jgi:hypothetical protein
MSGNSGNGPLGSAGVRRRVLLGGGALLGVLLLAACSGSTVGTAAPVTTPSATRQSGPAAAFQELTGGNGVSMGSPVTVSLTGTGYVQQEFAASGTATSYRAIGGFPGDGRWDFQPAGSAAYRTRVLVRRPANPAKFNGTVKVEWLNVSGGTDSDVEWWGTHEELLRSGTAWIGISAQLVGVMGGKILTPAAGASQSKGLKGSDPARYGTLNHPGDGYSFDMFTQVARGLRSGALPMGGLRPQRLIAAGESQSAFALVTYLNGVQPLTHEFDGFMVKSRGRAGLPLAAPGKAASIGDNAGLPTSIIRTDTDVPVLDEQTEGDLGAPLDSLPARQPDNPRFRLWEIAGGSHADTHSVGPYASALGCKLAINNSPTHIVDKAAFHALESWVRDGVAPPAVPRIQVSSGASPQVVRDTDGIAVGGIRTAPVAVPVDVLSGNPGPNPSVICSLFGSTTPLSAARIAELYPSRADYVQKYAAATDAMIQAGFALPADRAALVDYSQPSRVAG